MLEGLISNNFDHVVTKILSYLDYESLRNCLWTCSTWREFVVDNWSRLGFDNKEREHYLSNGTFSAYEIPVSPFSHMQFGYREKVLRDALGEEDLAVLNLRPDFQDRSCAYQLMMQNDKYFLFITDEGFTRVCKNTGEATKFGFPWWHPYCNQRQKILCYMKTYREYLLLQVQDFIRIFKLGQDARGCLVWHQDYLSDRDFNMLDKEPLDQSNTKRRKFWESHQTFADFNHGVGIDFLLLVCSKCDKCILHLTDLTHGKTLWKNEFELKNQCVPYNFAFSFENEFIALAYWCPEGENIYLRTYGFHGGKLLAEQTLTPFESDFRNLRLSSNGKNVLLAQTIGVVNVSISCYLFESANLKCAQRKLNLTNMPFCQNQRHFFHRLNSMKLCSDRFVVCVFSGICCCGNCEGMRFCVYSSVFAIFDLGTKQDISNCVKTVRIPGISFVQETRLSGENTWLFWDLRKKNEDLSYVYDKFRVIGCRKPLRNIVL